MRLPNCPKAAGRVPVRLLFELTCSWVTRGGVPLTVAMLPSQEDMASVTAQFRLAVPRNSSLSPSNVVQSVAKSSKVLG